MVDGEKKHIFPMLNKLQTEKSHAKRGADKCVAMWAAPKCTVETFWTRMGSTSGRTASCKTFAGADFPIASLIGYEWSARCLLFRRYVRAVDALGHTRLPNLHSCNSART